MYIERRLLSYIAMLIATIYYFFGRVEAAMPEPAAESAIIRPLQQ